MEITANHTIFPLKVTCKIVATLWGAKLLDVRQNQLQDMSFLHEQISSKTEETD